jgi:hypothetical protein
MQSDGRHKKRRERKKERNRLTEKNRQTDKNWQTVREESAERRNGHANKIEIR